MHPVDFPPISARSARAILPLLLAAALVACGTPEADSGGTAASPSGPTTAASPSGASPNGATSSATGFTQIGAVDTDVVIRGAGLYKKYCVLCHGAELQGYAADNAPSLVSPTWAATVDDNFLRIALERGRPGTAMAGFGRVVGGPLDAQAISDLMTFIRTKASVPRQPLPSMAIGGDAIRGAGIYAQKCAECHGTAAQRSTAVHLANPLFLQTASPAFIRHAIVFGRPGTKMVSFAPTLDGQATNDVVTYIHGLAGSIPSLPPLVPPTTPPPVPDWSPIPLNPNGGAPTFHLRDNRFAPMVEVNRALVEKKRIIIVDARPPSDWISMHITGSVSLPYYNLTMIDRIPNDGTWVIAYCGCPHHASGAVVDELRRRGYPHSAVLDEGVFAWQQKGFPIVAQAGMAGLAAPPVAPIPGQTPPFVPPPYMPPPSNPSPGRYVAPPPLPTAPPVPRKP